jgi:hypothetical protein
MYKLPSSHQGKLRPVRLNDEMSAGAPAAVSSPAQVQHRGRIGLQQDHLGDRVGRVQREPDRAPGQVTGAEGCD